MADNRILIRTLSDNEWEYISTWSEDFMRGKYAEVSDRLTSVLESDADSSFLSTVNFLATPLMRAIRPHEAQDSEYSQAMFEVFGWSILEWTDGWMDLDRDQLLDFFSRPNRMLGGGRSLGDKKKRICMSLGTSLNLYDRSFQGELTEEIINVQEAARA